MTRFQSFVILFTVMIFIVFQVSEVYGATWVSLKYHPIRALNDASSEKGFFRANKVKRFADIDVDAHYIQDLRIF